ncbi:MAG: hypothetical protein K6A80_01565 [Saccharofermentans sp.]|nr:hypothetical protein [Saccharofermentans sp.]
MDSVGSVGLHIKVLKNELIKDVKQSVREAASEVKKQSSSVSKSVVSSVGAETKALKGLTSVAKGLMSVLGIGISIAGLISFGKACVDLGSDLAEVQNVVDVVYADMNEQVNDFASSAIKAYGISETVAKEYMGTLGAMSKAFGYSTAEAYSQAEALTALAGDMASFYNKTTDETFTALKAVYSGETEVLKQYGVVMNETALNEFALSQGIRKTVKNMTEQEKVSLRLSFVQDRLSAAAGDFSRTSGGWANQVRVLSLQFDSFKASIGQGLINVLTPVVQWLNAIMEAANRAAAAFANFTAQITGTMQAATGGVAADVSAAAESANELSSGLSSAGGAAKTLKRSLAGFDKLNVLSSNAAGGGGAAGGIGNTGINTAAVKQATAAQTGLNKALEITKEVIKDIKASFSKGFDEGFAGFDTSKISTNIQNIREEIRDIFNDPDVISSGSNFTNNIAEGIGKVTGSLARIGSVSAEMFTGGFSRFLTEHSPEIKGYISDMFDIRGEEAQIMGNLSISVGNIFEGAFGTTAGEKLVSNLVNIPAQIYMSVQEIGAKIGRDLLSGFQTVIGDNEGGITSALSGIVETISDVTGTISTAVTYMGQTANDTYDTYISPFISNIMSGISELTSSFLAFWDENVKPILDDIAENAETIWDENLQPLWDSLMDFFGSVSELVSALWDTYLKPIIDWIIQNVLPVIAPIIRTLVSYVMNLVGIIGSQIKIVLSVLGGLMDFITGVLTGNWSKAWEGIKNIFSGAWDGIKSILFRIEDIFSDVFDGVIAVIKAALNLGIASIERFINNAIKAINTLLSGISAISEAVGIGSISKIKDVHLPRLAEGGFVEANTPQLALIGDNRHSGEIVAPEPKISEAVAAGFAQMMPQFINMMSSAMRTAVAAGSAGNGRTPELHLYLDGREIHDVVFDYENRNNSRSGGRA